MKRLSKILVPTDLSEHSRRALSYGCWLAAEDKAAVVILHVTSEINVWELSSEFEIYTRNQSKVWPLDRALAEATLDLNHFLEPHLAELKELPCATKRVVLGPVTDRITSIADEEKANLIIMSPRRSRGLRHWLSGGITDRVTRLSPARSCRSRRRCRHNPGARSLCRASSAGRAKAAQVSRRCDN